MSCVNLRDLSLEVLHEIFSHFECPLPLENWAARDPDRSGMATLASLSLTCRMFKPVAQPLLFRHLLLPSDDVSAFEKLIDILLEKPSLGLYARSFYWGSDLKSSVERFGLDIGRVLSRLQELDLPPMFEAILRFYVTESREFDLTVLGMLFMPNLEVVSIEDHCPIVGWMLSGLPVLNREVFNGGLLNSRIWPEDLDAALGKETEDLQESTRAYANFGLPALRELRPVYTSNEASLDLDTLEVALLHPGIETIRSVGMDWSFDLASRLVYKDEVFSVRALELMDCIIDAKGLEDIFKRCPQLESLSIALGSTRRMLHLDAEDFQDRSRLIGIADMLGKYGKNLKTIALHTGYEGDRFESVPEAANKGLTQLTNLRHLALDSEFFAKPSNPSRTEAYSSLHLQDILPHGLKTLHLLHRSYSYTSRGHEPIMREVRQLLAASEFPNLHEIRLDFQDGGGPASDESVPGWTLETTTEIVGASTWNDGCPYNITTLRKENSLESGDIRKGRGGFYSSNLELLPLQ